jgi:hypothetical protein
MAGSPRATCGNCREIKGFLTADNLCTEKQDENVDMRRCQSDMDSNSAPREFCDQKENRFFVWSTKVEVGRLMPSLLPREPLSLLILTQSSQREAPMPSSGQPPSLLTLCRSISRTDLKVTKIHTPPLCCQVFPRQLQRPFKLQGISNCLSTMLSIALLTTETSTHTKDVAPCCNNFQSC